MGIANIQYNGVYEYRSKCDYLSFTYCKYLCLIFANYRVSTTNQFVGTYRSAAVCTATFDKRP